MQTTPSSFQKLILHWFDKHGRKSLPWQQQKTPYRVWISEIMLQQTQVTTVIPYYERFIERFPDLPSLAKAEEDEVLHLWAGLGYYSRARNLHKAANKILANYGGEFPDTVADLLTLPGIGLSTAGAILAIAFNQRATILDGNVKRVLARFHGITAPINERKTENTLWEFASRYTPTKRVADYTQAMMDLGATLCVRGKPQCPMCPLHKTCSAHEQGNAHLLPKKKSTRKIPVRTATFVILKRNGHIFLHKRPSTGIWGGLWSLPEMDGIPDKKTVQAFCRQHFNHKITDFRMLEPFRHTFSHYHLDIHPIVIMIKNKSDICVEERPQIWYNPAKPESIGLPKPIQTIMRAFL